MAVPWSFSGSSSAKSGAEGGYYGGQASGTFGDFNVQYGGIGGASSASPQSLLMWGAVALAAYLAVKWLSKKT